MEEDVSNKGWEDCDSCFHVCGGFCMPEGQIQLKLEPTSQGSYPEKAVNVWCKTTQSVSHKPRNLYYPISLRLFSTTLRHCSISFQAPYFKGDIDKWLFDQWVTYLLSPLEPGHLKSNSWN